jgi:hypothetical protein
MQYNSVTVHVLNSVSMSMTSHYFTDTRENAGGDKLSSKNFRSEIDPKNQYIVKGSDRNVIS